VTPGQSNPDADAHAASARVVMIVGNDVRTDTRVKKTAIALARGGLQVTVVGYAPYGRRSESMLGPVRIIRVPVPMRLHDQRQLIRTRRRSAAPRVGFRDRKHEQAVRLRIDIQQLEINAATGRAVARRTSRPDTVVTQLGFSAGAIWRRAQILRCGVRRKSIGARVRLQRKLTAVVRRGWKAADRRIGRVPIVARWRRITPEILDFELAYSPVIERLAPDVIHAHDFHMVGIAAHAAARATLRGRRVRWVYDAHEYTPGMAQYGGRTRRVVAAYESLEREFIRSADRVITVSPAIAEELQRRYRLPRRPELVMNIPVVGPDERPDLLDGPSIRAVVGLDDDVPLLVYSGGATSARGVHTIVEALPSLPGAHLAIVAVPGTITPYLESLVDLAATLGVDDRVHLVPPVESHQVVPFLSSATLGVLPILRFPSYEMALPNKLFEYLNAHLPVVVSDMREMVAFVGKLGVGEVFHAEDPAGLAAAARRVIAGHDEYVDRIRERSGVLGEFTWERQAARLREVYADLLGPDAVAADPAALGPDVQSHAESPAAPGRSADQPLLGIGPANMAGQGWAWAKAVERAAPGVETLVFAVEKPTLNFPSNVLVSPRDFARSPAWQLDWSAQVLGSVTHVLMEAGRPVLGTMNGQTFAADVPVLRDFGITVGLVFHGSEIRDPRRHRQMYPFSPFRNPADQLTARLQRQVDELMPLVEEFDGPRFVSTPDLLDDVPGAIWLPVVVDTDVWRPGSRPPLARHRPVVVHAPSNAALKGTVLIEPVLRSLEDRGLIEYRRIEGVPPAQMPALIAGADIVLDHFGIGNYGVLTCQAMAAGRVSVSHIHQRVRARVGEEIPTVEATPDTLEDVLLHVLADRDAARETAARGPEFVRRYHDGTQSGAVLADFLGLSTVLSSPIPRVSRAENLVPR
jgi:glycosyltransferase involved in cell wall biosynthesis